LFEVAFVYLIWVIPYTVLEIILEFHKMFADLIAKFMYLYFLI
jgi:hypothetical protein